MEILGAVNLVANLFQLGEQAYRLYDGITASEREFRAFADELKTLGRIWNAIRPYIEQPESAGFTTIVWKELNQIYKDTETILEEIGDWLDAFIEKKEQLEARGIDCFDMLVHWITGRQKITSLVELHLKRFLSRNELVIHRRRLKSSLKYLDILLTLRMYA